MRLDSTVSNGTTYWAMPEDRARVLVDGSGTEWEVYDESTWSMELALEWDFLPQTENPGLIFASRVGRRRLRPCPDDWRSLADPQLIELLQRARNIL
jgi:hypothetical protein